jgi:iron complex outermembrane receptor protein
VAAGSPFLGLDQAVGIVPGPQNARLSSDAPTNNHFNVGGIQLNANYDMGGGYKVTEVAAYRKFQNQQIFDVDDHQINIANTNQGGQSDYQISNEIRLSSPDEKKLQYQIGLYYYYGRITGHNDIRANLGSSPPPGYTAVLGTFASSEENTSSYAVFGQATYRFTDQARLVVGARETYDDLDIHSFSSQGTNLIPLGLPGTVSSKQSINNTNFSFRVTGQFDFTRDIMGYASVARGYKGPGFNGAAFIINTPPIAPEIPTAFEIGLKTRLFEDRLTLNVSAFDETFKGFQAQGYNIATQSYLVTNAGQLNSRGFDATFTAVPVSDLTINGGVSFVDAFFHSYAKDQCYGGDPRCVGGIHDSTGNRLPNAPRWSGSVSADYRHDINERLRAFANIALSGRSLVNYSSNGDPHTIQPGYSLFDGSLGVGPRDGTWRVSAFCRNCFDQRFVTYIEANPVSPTDYGQQFGIDSFRTVGMSLDVKL